jgi:hypothetical protein
MTGGIQTVCPTCGSPVIADADTGRYLGLALLERAERAEKEAETLRATLQRIAGAESGVWGAMAHRVLREVENA